MDTMTGHGGAPAGRPVARDVLRVVLGTAALLLVPLAAMPFTREVDWGVEDFLAAALLLGGTGLAYIFLARLVRTPRRRAVLGAGLGLALLLAWAELAVGIFS